MNPSRGSIVLALLLQLAVTGALGAEEDECASAYNYLAGCLTFLQGPDALPNPICCSGVTDLNAIDPHCLCTIIQDLNQNSNVNYTKACALPSQCHIAVDVVQCPTLNLPLGYPMPPALPPGYRAAVAGDQSAAAFRRTPTTSLLLLVATVLTILIHNRLAVCWWWPS